MEMMLRCNPMRDRRFARSAATSDPVDVAEFFP
jgi:hypothetical protein